MKKTTLLNSDISRVIACMGHFDTLTIGDAGLPIPEHVERIDLALCLGVPDFLQVLKAVLTELEVQKVTIASEMKVHNPELYAMLHEILSGTQIAEVSHEKFKEQSEHSRAIVRTGECKPYANIILESGVVF